MQSTPSLRQLFFDSNKVLIAELSAALCAGDLKTALDNAHAIKGAGLLAGFSALAEAAGEVETSLLSARFDRAGAAVLRTRRLLGCADRAEPLP